jgi:hypothetical protein
MSRDFRAPSAVNACAFSRAALHATIRSFKICASGTNSGRRWLLPCRCQPLPLQLLLLLLQLLVCLSLPMSLRFESKVVYELKSLKLNAKTKMKA